MKNDIEKYSLCALNRIFGFDPKTALALIGHLGKASDIFRLSENDIGLLLGPFSKYKGRISGQALEDAAEEVERLSAGNTHFIGYTEPEYPELLRECEDAPLGLYVRSVTPLRDLFASRKRISVIGTRDISPYGREWCGKIVRELGRAEEKPVIVSGLALGTDICAHREAMESGLATIAVMATGPDAIYPWRHREFAERIAATEGCALITDYPPGTAPLAVHFLRRNRIIAGLSDATILIESKIKGGGMMTSRLAFSYNREVYALPGKVDDVRSQGCNLLIRSKIAEAIDSVSWLTESLGLHMGKAKGKGNDRETLERIFGKKADPEALSALSGIFNIIKNERGITPDDISARTGIRYSTVSQMIGMLETEGLISMDLLQRCTVNPRISR